MLAQINVNNQELTTLVPPETALARGSSFTNLYIPYKFETNKILKRYVREYGNIEILKQNKV